MTRPPIVLTVCLGNICRSPTAAAAITEAAAQRGVEVEVRSAGTGSWHVGNPPDPRTRSAALEAGLHLDGVAAQVDAAAIEAADLVVAMDRQNLADLQRIAEEGDITTPIRLFRSYDPEAVAAAEAGGDADTEYDALEVPDPYYGGPEGFVEVVAMSRAAAHGVIDALLADGLADAPRAS